MTILIVILLLCIVYLLYVDFSQRPIDPNSCEGRLKASTTALGLCTTSKKTCDRELEEATKAKALSHLALTSCNSRVTNLTTDVDRLTRMNNNLREHSTSAALTACQATSRSYQNLAELKTKEIESLTQIKDTLEGQLSSCNNKKIQLETTVRNLNQEKQALLDRVNGGGGGGGDERPETNDGSTLSRNLTSLSLDKFKGSNIIGFGTYSPYGYQQPSFTYL